MGAVEKDEELGVGCLGLGWRYSRTFRIFSLFSGFVEKGSIGAGKCITQKSL